MKRNEAFKNDPLLRIPSRPAALPKDQNNASSESAAKADSAEWNAQLCRELLTQIPDAVTIVQDEYFKFVGPPFTEAFGYTQEDVERGLCLLDLIRLDERDLAHQRYQDRLSGATLSKTYCLNFVAKNGTVVPCETTGTLVSYEGRPADLIVIRDITERKQAEDAIRQQRDLLLTLVNTIPNPVFFKDTEGRYTVHNRAFAQLFGRGGEDLTGLTVYDVRPKDLADPHQQIDQEILATLGKREYEWQHVMAGGDARNIVFHKAAIPGPEGNATGIVGIVTDVTERTNTANLLRIERDLGLQLSWTSSLKEALACCMNSATSGTGMEAGGVFLLDERDGSVDLIVHCGISDAMAQRIKRSAADSPVARIVMKDRPHYYPQGHVESGLEELFRVEGFETVAILPVFSEDRVIGCLSVASRSQVKIREFKRTALESIASHMGTAIMRVRMEEALRESEEKFRVITASALDAIILIDAEGRTAYWNEAAERIFGYTAQEIMGKNIHDFITPERYQEQVKRGMEEFRQSGGGFAIGKVLELHANRKDGTEIPIEIAVSSISLGGQHWASAIIRDITERKRVEETLLQREARLQSIFRAAPMGIGLSVDHVLKDVNERLCKMVGYTREELLGSETRRFFSEKEDFEQVIRAEEEQIRKRGKATIETRLVHKDGRLLDVLLAVTPLDADDWSAGLTFTALDITDYKRSESERREMERRILETQKLESLGVLAGGIAHDFNNILTAVLGHAELALDALSPMAPARDSIQEIEHATRRAADLCRQMLAYSGRGKFVIETINLQLLVEEMMHLLKTSISKKAILNLNLKAGLPPFRGDPTQIRQVVMNLVVNASEAIGETPGMITITTGVERCTEKDLAHSHCEENPPPGNYVTLEVSDTGCGMNKSTLDRIFEPFFTTKFTGRGLGMSAVLGIMRGHGGALQVRSEMGKGTTFRLLFPAMESDRMLETKPKEDERAAWNPAGKTVLLVDDEDAVRSLGKRMLERLGLTVLTAEDGRKALEVYARHADDIALVMLDLTMPKMNGEETFLELRRLNPNVQVVLTSGYTEMEITTRFADMGLAGFIQKPYALRSLTEGLSPILQ